MRLWALAAMVVFVLVVVAPEARGGGGTAITSCGQVVTTNAFLTQNLHCPGSDGIVVGADKITIDLKGFRLRGNTTGRGIYDNGFDQVTIRNGTVRNFDSGVEAGSTADRVTVQNVVASGNLNVGIHVAGTSAKIQSSNASGNEGSGVIAFGDSATIQSVTASGNRTDGIFIGGNSGSVKSSSADGNASFGIFVIGDLAKITGSTGSGNVEGGISWRFKASSRSVVATITDADRRPIGEYHRRTRVLRWGSRELDLRRVKRPILSSGRRYAVADNGQIVAFLRADYGHDWRINPITTELDDTADFEPGLLLLAAFVGGWLERDRDNDGL